MRGLGERELDCRGLVLREGERRSDRQPALAADRCALVAGEPPVRCLAHATEDRTCRPPAATIPAATSAAAASPASAASTRITLESHHEHVVAIPRHGARDDDL